MPTYQDISRHTSNVILDPEVSAEIWAKTIEESAFMQLARRIDIPGTGVKVQTITGEPTAGWVDETNAKPVGFHTFGAKTITLAPGQTTIATAYANLSDEASNPVIIMNKATYADFVAAAAAGNFQWDPFMGLPVVFSSALPTYSAATAGSGKYAIVGDLGVGYQVNYPEGEGVVIKYDDLSLAEADLVKIVGRQYAAHDAVAPFAFCRIVKPSA